MGHFIEDESGRGIRNGELAAFQHQRCRVLPPYFMDAS